MKRIINGIIIFVVCVGIGAFSIINNKDTKFDTELSKLETERTTITTEMDSIKKVKDDNIERTFGIFS